MMAIAALVVLVAGVSISPEHTKEKDHVEAVGTLVLTFGFNVENMSDGDWTPEYPEISFYPPGELPNQTEPSATGPPESPEIRVSVEIVDHDNDATTFTDSPEDWSAAPDGSPVLTTRPFELLGVGLYSIHVLAEVGSTAYACGVDAKLHIEGRGDVVPSVRFSGWERALDPAEDSPGGGDGDVQP
jgi:hypothetical protein